MRFHRIGLLCSVLFVSMATPFLVAQTADGMKMFTSSADVQALIAKAKSTRKDQPLISQPLLKLAPYLASLEYRASVGPAAVHEGEAEFFYVIDGGGTLVTGGKLVNEVRMNPANVNGSAIEGGTSRVVAKGDFIVVPQGVPHWFNAIDGVLVLMTLHVPRVAQ
jgi:mannose-6-phosphate isomerase-like protein (cupin superfamily)